jgi:hypothetical protein
LDGPLKEVPMASWMKCTTADGAEIRVNMDQVAMIRRHASDRGGTGSEITFASGSPSSIVVKEDQDHLVGALEVR